MQVFTTNMIAGCLWTGDTHDLLGHIYILLILFSYRPPGSVSSSCLSEKQNIKLVWTNDVLGVTASQSVLIKFSYNIFCGKNFWTIQSLPPPNIPVMLHQSSNQGGGAGWTSSRSWCPLDKLLLCSTPG